ncbi:hypothetical protein PIB30_063543 [Stylosanthes scabra]|uniref:Uncharacterized protein n=1 Tax=Stylosanthes scabra TaxID=79078 RepID=A0ABU6SLI9_9FABA|nr:hypothetical protein [Stylosanthes scabra]
MGRTNVAGFTHGTTSSTSAAGHPMSPSNDPWPMLWPCTVPLMQPTNAATNLHGTQAMVECRGLSIRDFTCTSQSPMPHPSPTALVYSNLTALSHDTRYRYKKSNRRNNRRASDGKMENGKKCNFGG